MRILPFFVTGLSLTVHVANGEVVSTFDSSLEGWTGAEISHMATGGNPGGYIHFVDPDSSGNSVIAPAMFQGDWTVFQSLSYDHRIFGTGTINQIVDYEVQISGPGGSAVWTSDPATGVTPWVTLVASLQEAEWSVSGSWAGLLSNVTTLSIRIEHVDNSGGGDVEGIDNVRLSGVPGDFDHDGDVDGDDFLQWQRDYGDIYDSMDLVDWETNYGFVSPISTQVAVVPEPTALCLVIQISFLGIFCGGRAPRASRQI